MRNPLNAALKIKELVFCKLRGARHRYTEGFGREKHLFSTQFSRKLLFVSE